MARKILCVVLSIIMLMSTLAIASSAAQYDYYDYTAEEAAEEVASKWWYEEYDEDVDYKDFIDRRFLSGLYAGEGEWPEVAASEEIREEHLYFWKDEIIEAYHSATSNEDYFNLYNKMTTPLISYLEYEENGETIVEADVLYDYMYEYRAEEKAEINLTIDADVEYAQPGDIITVEVYAKTNYLTFQWSGGIFYDKRYLEPIAVEFNEEDVPGWKTLRAVLDYANEYNDPNRDWRRIYWPSSMISDENLEKYGVSWSNVIPDATLGYTDGIANFDYASKLDGKFMTATYRVKDDVPEGTKLEFFSPSDSDQHAVTDLLPEEWPEIDGGRKSIFFMPRMSLDGKTVKTQNFLPDIGAKYDHTIVANTEVVTIGTEPAPAVKGEVVSATTETGTIYENVPVSIEVTGSPDSIRLVSADDSATTYTRDDATIVATEAGEIWTIDVYAATEEATYDVYASYGDLGWTEDAVEVTVTAAKALDDDVISIEIPDSTKDGEDVLLLLGKHDVIVTTGTDVTKVQFMTANGGTYTYGSHAADAVKPYKDVLGEDGEYVRVWTINHSFSPYGDISLDVRTRTYDTFFVDSGYDLKATVVY